MVSPSLAQAAGNVTNGKAAAFRVDLCLPGFLNRGRHLTSARLAALWPGKRDDPMAKPALRIALC